MRDVGIRSDGAAHAREEPRRGTRPPARCRRRAARRRSAGRRARRPQAHGVLLGRQHDRRGGGSRGATAIRAMSRARDTDGDRETSSSRPPASRPRVRSAKKRSGRAMPATAKTRAPEGTDDRVARAAPCAARRACASRGTPAATPSAAADAVGGRVVARVHQHRVGGRRRRQRARAAALRAAAGPSRSLSSTSQQIDVARRAPGAGSRRPARGPSRRARARRAAPRDSDLRRPARATPGERARQHQRLVAGLRRGRRGCARRRRRP